MAPANILFPTSRGTRPLSRSIFRLLASTDPSRAIGGADCQSIILRGFGDDEPSLGLFRSESPALGGGRGGEAGLEAGEASLLAFEARLGPIRAAKLPGAGVTGPLGPRDGVPLPLPLPLLPTLVLPMLVLALLLLMLLVLLLRPFRDPGRAGKACGPRGTGVWIVSS